MHTEGPQKPITVVREHDQAYYMLLLFDWSSGYPCGHRWWRLKMITGEVMSDFGTEYMCQRHTHGWEGNKFCCYQCAVWWRALVPWQIQLDKRRRSCKLESSKIRRPSWVDTEVIIEYFKSGFLNSGISEFIPQILFCSDENQEIQCYYF